jgi:hypothetical protein
VEGKWKITQDELAETLLVLKETEGKLDDTRAQLENTQRLLAEARAVIRAEEIRRETSKCVGTQFGPQTTEMSIQTEFLVPDLNLRHALALEDARVGKIFVERIVTPAVAMPVNRRCSTAVGVGAGGVIVSGDAMDRPEDDMEEAAGGEELRSHFSQPIGSLRKDMQDFMRRQPRPDSNDAFLSKGLPKRSRSRVLSPIRVRLTSAAKA